MRRSPGTVVTVIAAASIGVTAAGTATTYARFSDFHLFGVSHVAAGVWAPDPPAACGPLSDYKGGVIYGTIGDDTLNLSDSNQRQIVMGYAGNDTIYGGNSGDCLVGGEGADAIVGGNAKDILIGGPGDDHLDGGNAKDEIDAGGDLGDVCDGGNGADTVTNCGGTP
jgi:Ca2+-binding RTX toxin-like protein